MDYCYRIVSDIAERESGHICRKVIRTLQRMTEERQSGEGTPLKNIWDEVCVQIQSQESVMWDAYLDTIRSLIGREVEKLPETVKHAIWLQTEQGQEWDFDEEKAEDPLPYWVDDVIEPILNIVLSSAADWTNKRITQYLEAGCEMD